MGERGEHARSRVITTNEMQVCTAKSTETIPTYRRAHKYTQEPVATAFIEASSSEGKASGRPELALLSTSCGSVELAGL